MSLSALATFKFSRDELLVLKPYLQPFCKLRSKLGLAQAKPKRTESVTLSPIVRILAF